MASFHRSSFIKLFFLSVFLLLPGKLLHAQTCGNVGNDCDTDPDCSDGDPCNGVELCFASGGVDTFSSPTCHCGTPPADNTVSCASDGTFCNGTEQCVGGTCSGHTGNPCSGTECNTCNETDDNCFDPVGTACTDDGNFCTTDACNGTGTCVSSNNDFLCDDLVNCTINDVCFGGACNGTPVQCDDGITCTLDACDETDGSCRFDSGLCECQTDADCNDNNVCTDEFCCTDPQTCAPNEIFTCIRSNNTGPCDDNLFCNGTDTCSGGTCAIHTGDPCTGGGQCDQTCDEIGDNCFAPTGVACDDGDILTVTQCDGGGKCATVETFSTQGSTLGCSLQRGNEDRSRSMLLMGAFVLTVGGLARRFKSIARPGSRF